MIMASKFNDDVPKKTTKRCLLCVCIQTLTHTYAVCHCFCSNFQQCLLHLIWRFFPISVYTVNARVHIVYVYKIHISFYIAMNNVWEVSIIALRSQLLTRTHTHTHTLTRARIHWYKTYIHTPFFIHNVSQHKIGFTFFVYLFACLFVHSAPSSSCFALLRMLFSPSLSVCAFSCLLCLRLCQCGQTART